MNSLSTVICLAKRIDRKTWSPVKDLDSVIVFVSYLKESIEYLIRGYIPFLHPPLLGVESSRHFLLTGLLLILCEKQHSGKDQTCVFTASLSHKEPLSRWSSLSVDTLLVLITFYDLTSLSLVPRRGSITRYLSWSRCHCKDKVGSDSHGTVVGYLPGRVSTLSLASRN